MKSPRRTRFEKVASNRVQKVIDFLTLLGNCSNTNNYEYDEEDVRKMFSVIKDQLKTTEAQFGVGITKTGKNKFKF